MRAYDGGKHVGMRWGAEKKGDNVGGDRQVEAGREEGKEENEEEEEGSVGYEAVDKVEVTTREQDARWRKVCVDGTIVEIPTGGSMTIATEKTTLLRILVDRSAL